MDTFLKVLIFVSAILIACDAVNAAARNATNSTGVCEIEVPTISILPPELKHTAKTIKGNGTTTEMSKIRICCAGYIQANYSPLNCMAYCADGCGLGNCTSPNVCTCQKDAVRGPDGKCSPTCPKGCLNGGCNGKYCNCNFGFTLEPNGKFCVAGCTKNCGPGGECVSNNQCSCRSGYQLNRQGVCEVFCSPGYNVVGNACEPQCPKGCVNGDCVAPGKCNCRSGYTIDGSGTVCTPKCNNSCLNGVCSAPNVCACNTGYVKDPTDSKGSRCIAHCPQGCVNGFCSAPNFCLCNQGYVKQSKGSNVCVKK